VGGHLEDEGAEEGQASSDGDDRRPLGPLGHRRPHRPRLLTGSRVAVVTGASSGIGASLCRALRARGWLVVGLSRSQANDVDEWESCDVANRGAVEEVAARILARHPRIDLLVNNAGIGARTDFLDADPERIERVVDVDYLGSVWTLRAFLPGLERGAHVVNVISVAGAFASGPYSAAKHAQLAFSRSVAVELAPRGVSVHTVLPGYVETPGFPQRERFGPFLGRLVVDPPLVADRILGAIEHGRTEIVVPRWYRPAAWLQALVPGTLARVRGRLGDPRALRRSVRPRR
jgi:NAD(P)-dependent dehydrogenase (short-subunit alcohol dehydrogenase family)